MYIVLGGIVWIITIFAGVYILFDGTIKVIEKIHKDGYKIDKKAYDEIREENKTINKKNSILPFIPIVNIVYAGITFSKYKKYMETQVKEQMCIPMSESEKEFYSTLKNKTQRIIYINHLMNETEEQKENTVFAFIGNKPCNLDKKLVEAAFNVEKEKQEENNSDINVVNEENNYIPYYSYEEESGPSLTRRKRY